MQDISNSAPLAALLKALKPIASLLLKAGIGYREFAEIAKWAFVDVASSDYGLRGRPTNISRVAVMTGLTRKDVKRFREKTFAGEHIRTLRVIPPAEILERWHRDPSYLDDDHRPRPLPFDGSGFTFSTLVKQYGGDIPPGAMRTELKRVNAISETEDGRLVAVRRDFRPIEKDDQVERALAHAIYGIALSIDHNLSQPVECSWVERVAYTSKIRTIDVGRLRRTSQGRAAEFVESIDDLFSAYESSNLEDQHREDDPENALTVVGIGVYYFEDDDPHSPFRS